MDAAMMSDDVWCRLIDVVHGAQNKPILRVMQWWVVMAGVGCMLTDFVCCAQKRPILRVIQWWVIMAGVGCTLIDDVVFGWQKKLRLRMMPSWLMSATWRRTLLWICSSNTCRSPLNWWRSMAWSGQRPMMELSSGVSAFCFEVFSCHCCWDTLPGDSQLLLFFILPYNVLYLFRLVFP